MELSSFISKCLSQSSFTKMKDQYGNTYRISKQSGYKFKYNVIVLLGMIIVLLTIYFITSYIFLTSSSA